MNEELMAVRESKYSDLILWIEKNDSKSFRLLYDTSNKHLLFYAFKIVKNAQMAEEVVQETFVSIWLNANRYDKNMGSPVTWMRKIAKNKALDALRVSNVYLRNEFIEDLNLQNMHDDFFDPEEKISKKQASITVMKYLRGLSGSQMEVIYLSYYDGLSHTEVASLLSEPLGTVKNRIRLGMMSLKRKQLGLKEAYALSISE